MSRRPGTRPHGQIRQSQLITSFGPGAMLDLPNHSVVVGGLDSWSTGGEEIVEPRLVEKLKSLFDPPLTMLKLHGPPPDPDDPTAPQTGITAWQFPEWFITQDVDTEASRGTIRARMLVHRRMLTKGKFIDDRKKKRSVVPVRFVRACRNGHIGDIDWYSFAHGGETDCRRQLWIEERGTTGDLSEVWVRCECGRGERSMLQASERTVSLGHCDGNRPWLGPYSKERCGEPNRLLIRTASNAYFPQLMSVISLPDRNETLREAVETVWDFVGEVEDLEMLRYERKKAKVHKVLEPYSDEEVLDEVQIRRGHSLQQQKSIKQAEMETLMASKEELGDDRPDGNFYARTLSREVWNAPWMKKIERIVLVHRLREVMAQVGFTRFEAVSPDIDGELEMGVRRAPLAREVTWLPAIETRGEGIFLQFSSDEVKKWVNRTDVIARGKRLLAGYDAWKDNHNNATKKFVEAGGLLPYVLFHSFSHLLLTAVALECGYPASSIRERIYAIPHVGFGVLLYTGTSDAEGTLGGLVQVGRRIHEHVRNALELGQLCSNDPVCAQHEPANLHERRFLHGAACHGCLLISETSCEQHNEFLDRALVVPTVDNLGIEFFKLA
ncbi:DrmB family protein [Planctomicrobium sp. SH664]|uniref:DrmB family protein n=1 Tax=Planctomicrobium sp. SH664 TaxID=3448125 RepID=UPI003F5B8A1A